jgi:hypothetical protein
MDIAGNHWSCIEIGHYLGNSSFISRKVLQFGLSEYHTQTIGDFDSVLVLGLLHTP